MNHKSRINWFTIKKQPGPYNFTALLQNSCGAFLGKLAGIEVVVIAALLQQLQVPALLDDAAVAHDEDEVRLADGGQAVGDQERRAVAQQVVDGVLDITLAVRAAGKVLTNIPNSRLTWKQENKTRTIDKTGVYKPPGSAKQNLPVKRNRVPRLVIIGAIMLVLISTGCFVYHKKERKH